MTTKEISGVVLLAWRRNQLSLGGRSVDLDWLLDIGGGLKWSCLQKLFLEPSRKVKLTKSLEKLEICWRKHLEESIPLQYLVGYCPWRDFELEITADALIPRQETEILVDIALSIRSLNSSGVWVDLGTGSGALAVALARALPAWQGLVVDCSPNALELARRNLEKLAPNAKWELFLGSWWEPLKPWWGSIELALVNPPYIPSAIVEYLAPVVRDHEPRLALCGGPDGLSHLRQVINGATQSLSKGGWLLLEHHHDQSEIVLSLMKENGFKDVDYGSDLSGIKRFAIGRWF